MAQRQLIRHHRAIPAACDGKQQHPEMRNRCDEKYAEEKQAANCRFPATDPQRRRARLRPWRCAERRTTHDKLRHSKNTGGHDEQQRSESVRNRISIKSLEPIKNLHRCDPRVVKNQRHPELSESPNENDGCARKYARHGERQGDSEESFPRRAAEIFRSLLHRRIEIRQSGGDVHVENWIEMERVHQHDPDETAVSQPVVGQRCVHQAGFDEQRIESAVHAEHLFHPDCADKGRQDHRH